MWPLPDASDAFPALIRRLGVIGKAEPRHTRDIIPASAGMMS
jgi:hypothetical protein